MLHFTMYDFLKNLTIGRNVGYVKSVGDGVVKATGLRGVAYGDIVYFSSAKIKGLTYNLNSFDVDILVLGDDRNIKTGDLVIGSGSGLYVPVSKKLLGRIINPLGEVLDGGLPIDEISVTPKFILKPHVLF